MYIPKRVKNKDSNMFFCDNVQSSILHNKQKVETTQVFINR